ncbi:hypothetical protein CRYUN_Cryun02cG0069100 [Craigia yunnanensis]
MVPEKIVHHIVQELLGLDGRTCSAEENVEAICQFFNTIGKQLDESPKSRQVNDIYFSRLKELTTNPQLAPRLRFMVKAKTITEIHSEAEKNLGLRPGATAIMRNGRNSAALGGMVPGGFPHTRADSGGMMPGMPGLDADNWEIPRTQSMPRGDGLGLSQPAERVPQPFISKSPSINSKFLPQGRDGMEPGKSSPLLQSSGVPPARSPSFEPVNSKPVVSAAAAVNSPEKPVGTAIISNPANLQRKTKSLLEEYFSIRLLDEVLQCIEELKAPTFHPEIVKEAIALALENNPPCVDAVVKLLEFLLNENVFTARDIGTGSVLYGSLMDDIGIDLPKAPNNFGEVIGKVVVAGGLDFTVIKEILMKVEDEQFQKSIFGSAIGSALLGKNCWQCNRLTCRLVRICFSSSRLLLSYLPKCHAGD